MDAKRTIHKLEFSTDLVLVEGVIVFFLLHLKNFIHLMSCN